MKRFLFSALVILLATATNMPAAAIPRQTHLNDPVADLNGDGVVTLTELKNYNRDARQS